MSESRAGEPQPSESQSATARSRAKVVALLGARFASATIAVGALALLVTSGSVLPLPELRGTLPQYEIVPQAAPQVLACPGPLVRLGDESLGGSVVAFGAPSVVAGGSLDIEESALEAPDVAGSTSRPTVLTSTPEGGSRSITAGSQSQSVATEELAGFAAAPCVAPSDEQWLVGGATTVGRSTSLVLLNPGQVSATVSIELWGEQGAIAAPGTGGIVVPAGEQVVLPLAGFAPELSSPVVRVTSTTGRVAASLQQSIVRGIEPGGVEIVSPSVRPDVNVAIPGVVISGAGAIGERVGEPGFEDLQPAIRVLAPGDQPGELFVSVVPEDPDDSGLAFSLAVDPGRVVDFPLEGLSSGRYAVTIESSVPVTAAVRGTSLREGELDFAWFATAPLLAGDAAVAVAPGPAARLYLNNPSHEPVTVSIAVLGGDDDDVAELEIVGNATVSIAVERGEVHVVSGFDGLRAAVVHSGTGRLASYPVLPQAPAVPPVTVVG